MITVTHIRRWLDTVLYFLDDALREAEHKNYISRVRPEASPGVLHLDVTYDNE